MRSAIGDPVRLRRPRGRVDVPDDAQPWVEDQHDPSAVDFAAYGEKFAAALDALTAGLPKAKIFIVGQWGSLASYVRALRSLPTNDRLKHAGKKPCSSSTRRWRV